MILSVKLLTACVTTPIVLGSFFWDESHPCIAKGTLVSQGGEASAGVDTLTGCRNRCTNNVTCDFLSYDGDTALCKIHGSDVTWVPQPVGSSNHRFQRQACTESDNAQTPSGVNYYVTDYVPEVGERPWSYDEAYFVDLGSFAGRQLGMMLDRNDRPQDTTFERWRFEAYQTVIVYLDFWYAFEQPGDLPTWLHDEGWELTGLTGTMFRCSDRKIRGRGQVYKKAFAPFTNSAGGAVTHFGINGDSRVSVYGSEHDDATIFPYLGFFDFNSFSFPDAAVELLSGTYTGLSRGFHDGRWGYTVNNNELKLYRFSLEGSYYLDMQMALTGNYQDEYWGGFTHGTYGYLSATGRANANGDTMAVQFHLGNMGLLSAVSTKGLNPAAVGYRGGFQDGVYGYMVPYCQLDNFGWCPDGGHGFVVRFELETFQSVDFMLLDVSSTKAELRGFEGGFHDGTYGYLLPNEFEFVTRFDLDTFAQVEWLELTNHTSGSGGFTDCFYGFKVPGGTDSILHRFHLAYFTDAFVDSHDLAQHSVSASTGFRDGFSDGHYGYVVPYTSNHLIRFVTSTFSDFEVLQSVSGFAGGFQAGEYAYLMASLPEANSIARLNVVGDGTEDDPRGPTGDCWEFITAGSLVLSGEEDDFSFAYDDRLLALDEDFQLTIRFSPSSVPPLHVVFGDPQNAAGLSVEYDPVALLMVRIGDSDTHFSWMVSRRRHAPMYYETLVLQCSRSSLHDERDCRMYFDEDANGEPWTFTDIDGSIVDRSLRNRIQYGAGSGTLEAVTLCPWSGRAPAPTPFMTCSEAAQFPTPAPTAPVSDATTVTTTTTTTTTAAAVIVCGVLADDGRVSTREFDTDNADWEIASTSPPMMGLAARDVTLYALAEDGLRIYTQAFSTLHTSPWEHFADLPQPVSSITVDPVDDRLYITWLWPYFYISYLRFSDAAAGHIVWTNRGAGAYSLAFDHQLRRVWGLLPAPSSTFGAGDTGYIAYCDLDSWPDSGQTDRLAWVSTNHPSSSMTVFDGYIYNTISGDSIKRRPPSSEIYSDFDDTPFVGLAFVQGGSGGLLAATTTTAGVLWTTTTTTITTTTTEGVRAATTTRAGVLWTTTTTAFATTTTTTAAALIVCGVLPADGRVSTREFDNYDADWDIASTSPPMMDLAVRDATLYALAAGGERIYTQAFSTLHTSSAWELLADLSEAALSITVDPVDDRLYVTWALTSVISYAKFSDLAAGEVVWTQRGSGAYSLAFDHPSQRVWGLLVSGSNMIAYLDLADWQDSGSTTRPTWVTSGIGSAIAFTLFDGYFYRTTSSSVERRTWDPPWARVFDTPFVGLAFVHLTTTTPGGVRAATTSTAGVLWTTTTTTFAATTTTAGVLWTTTTTTFAATTTTAGVLWTTTTTTFATTTTTTAAAVIVCGVLAADGRVSTRELDADDADWDIASTSPPMLGLAVRDVTLYALAEGGERIYTQAFSTLHASSAWEVFADLSAAALSITVDPVDDRLYVTWAFTSIISYFKFSELAAGAVVWTQRGYGAYSLAFDHQSRRVWGLMVSSSSVIVYLDLADWQDSGSTTQPTWVNAGMGTATALSVLDGYMYRTISSHIERLDVRSPSASWARYDDTPFVGLAFVQAGAGGVLLTTTTPGGVRAATTSTITTTSLVATSTSHPTSSTMVPTDSTMDPSLPFCPLAHTEGKRMFTVIDGYIWLAAHVTTSCTDGNFPPSLQWSWQELDGHGRAAIVDAPQARPYALELEISGLPVLGRYLFRGALEGYPDNWLAYEVELVDAPPPRLVLVIPPTVPQSCRVTLDASGSSDPSGAALSFAWSCTAQDPDKTNACQAVLSTAAAASAAVPSIPGGSLAVGRYLMGVTVYRGASGRVGESNSSGEAHVEITDALMPVVAIEQVAARISPHVPLEVAASVDAGDGGPCSGVPEWRSWWLVDSLAESAELLSQWQGGGLRLSIDSLPAGSSGRRLRDGGAHKLRFVLTDTQQEVWKAADVADAGGFLYDSTAFEVDTPPDGGLGVVVPSHGAAIVTSFHLETSGWIDDELPLEYRFSVQASPQHPEVYLSGWSLAPMFFPAIIAEHGADVTIWAHARNALGSVAKIGTSVHVEEFYAHVDQHAEDGAQAEEILYDALDNANNYGSMWSALATVESVNKEIFQFNATMASKSIDTLSESGALSHQDSDSVAKCAKSIRLLYCPDERCAAGSGGHLETDAESTEFVEALLHGATKQQVVHVHHETSVDVADTMGFALSSVSRQAHGDQRDMAGLGNTIVHAMELLADIQAGDMQVGESQVTEGHEPTSPGMMVHLAPSEEISQQGLTHGLFTLPPMSLPVRGADALSIVQVGWPSSPFGWAGDASDGSRRLAPSGESTTSSPSTGHLAITVNDTGVVTLEIRNGGEPVPVSGLDEPVLFTVFADVGGGETLEEDTYDPTLTYSVIVTETTSSASCRFWRESTEAWSDEGCEVVAVSGGHAIDCACTHFTSFTGAVEQEVSNLGINNVEFMEKGVPEIELSHKPVRVVLVWCLLIYLPFICCLAKDYYDYPRLSQRKPELFKDDKPYVSDAMCTLFPGIYLPGGVQIHPVKLNCTRLRRDLVRVLSCRGCCRPRAPPEDERSSGRGSSAVNISSASSLKSALMPDPNLMLDVSEFAEDFVGPIGPEVPIDSPERFGGHLFSTQAIPPLRDDVLRAVKLLVHNGHEEHLAHAAFCKDRRVQSALKERDAQHVKDALHTVRRLNRRWEKQGTPRSEHQIDSSALTMEVLHLMLEGKRSEDRRKSSKDISKRRIRNLEHCFQMAASHLAEIKEAYDTASLPKGVASLMPPLFSVVAEVTDVTEVIQVLPSGQPVIPSEHEHKHAHAKAFEVGELILLWLSTHRQVVYLHRTYEALNRSVFLAPHSHSVMLALDDSHSNGDKASELIKSTKTKSSPKDVSERVSFRHSFAAGGSAEDSSPGGQLEVVLPDGRALSLKPRQEMPGPDPVAASGGTAAELGEWAQSIEMLQADAGAKVMPPDDQVEVTVESRPYGWAVGPRRVGCPHHVFGVSHFAGRQRLGLLITSMAGTTGVLQRLLRPGMQLLRVDGACMQEARFEEIVHVLENGELPMVLTFRKAIVPDVWLTMSNIAPKDFKLIGCGISDLSQRARCMGFREGDEILQINGRQTYDCLGKATRLAKRLIAASLEGHIQLGLRRPGDGSIPSAIQELCRLSSVFRYPRPVHVPHVATGPLLIRVPGKGPAVACMGWFSHGGLVLTLDPTQGLIDFCVGVYIQDIRSVALLGRDGIPYQNDSHIAKAPPQSDAPEPPQCMSVASSASEEQQLVPEPCHGDPPATGRPSPSHDDVPPPERCISCRDDHPVTKTSTTCSRETQNNTSNAHNACSFRTRKVPESDSHHRVLLELRAPPVQGKKRSPLELLVLECSSAWEQALLYHRMRHAVAVLESDTSELCREMSDDTVVRCRTSEQPSVRRLQAKTPMESFGTDGEGDQYHQDITGWRLKISTLPGMDVRLESLSRRSALLARSVAYQRWSAFKIIRKVLKAQHPISKMLYPYRAMTRTQRYGVVVCTLQIAFFLQTFFFETECAMVPPVAVCQANKTLSALMFQAFLFGLIFSMPVPILITSFFRKRPVHTVMSLKAKRRQIHVWYAKEVSGWITVWLVNLFAVYWLLSFAAYLSWEVFSVWVEAALTSLASRFLWIPVARGIFIAAMVLTSTCTSWLDNTLSKHPAWLPRSQQNFSDEIIDQVDFGDIDAYGGAF